VRIWTSILASQHDPNNLATNYTWGVTYLRSWADPEAKISGATTQFAMPQP